MSKENKIRMTRYEIDYEFGRAMLYTPYPDWEKRFLTLAGTCFGIRKNIGQVKLLSVKEGFEPTCLGECEALEAEGDSYIWREDGARRMISPFPDVIWDMAFCNKCAAKEAVS